MEELQKFIKDYFRLLNLRNMPEAVFDRYKKYIKDNDFPNKDVKSWKNFIDPTTNTWQNLPDFSTLSDDEIDLLYKDLLQTFDAMNSHKRSLSEDSKKFVESYFGQNKTFSVPSIPATEKSQIIQLLTLVKDDEVPVYLGWDEQPVIQEVLDGNKDVNNGTVKRIVFNIINQIKQAQQQGNLSPEAENKLAPLGLNNLQNKVNQEIQITATDRANLRNSGAKIFKTLFDKKKVFEDFQKYETGEKFVSEQIEKALSSTDYTGKTNEKNYVPAQYKDDLNLRQTVEKKLNDTYDDVLKKYLSLHRANLFIKPEAKAIFGALDKAKLKPTDGITKILEKAGDVTKSLKGKQPFEAADHFKWMTDKLSDYADHGMGKAIEGALRNGHQMKHIIEQLILDAVKEGKVKEAKTAMEVLSVMQYGLFTSRTMDAINKTDMTIFSDGKLSWNKNEGIQFVTKAFDKTIKTGIQAAGYATTAAVNKIRRMGRTFDHSGKINDKSNDRIAELTQQKADFDSEKATKDAAFDAEIAANEAQRTATGITDINVARNDLTSGEALEARRKRVLDGRQAKFGAMNKIETDFNNRESLKNEITNILNEANILKNNLLAMPNPLANQYEQALADKIRKEFQKKEEEARQKINEVQQIEDEYNNVGLTLDAEHNRIHTITPPATQCPYDLAQMKLNNAQTAYDNQHNANETLRNHINEYEEATENIDTAQRQKRELQTAADEWDDKHKNEYLELMGYWDFLQSGNTKSLFHWSTKKLQAKMDARQTSGKTKMEEALLLWQQQHSYAA